MADGFPCADRLSELWRAKQLEYYNTHNTRPRPREMVASIFTRDKPGTGDPRVADALANAELKYGDSVPTGTYLDMTSKLPIIEAKLAGLPRGRSVDEWLEHIRQSVEILRGLIDDL